MTQLSKARLSRLPKIQKPRMNRRGQNIDETRSAHPMICPLEAPDRRGAPCSRGTYMIPEPMPESLPRTRPAVVIPRG
jgi:hypothetical protein